MESRWDLKSILGAGTLPEAIVCPVGRKISPDRGPVGKGRAGGGRIGDGGRGVRNLTPIDAMDENTAWGALSKVLYEYFGCH